MYYENGKRSIYLWIIVLILIIAILNTPFIKRSRILRAARVLSANIIYPVKYAGYAVYIGTTSVIGDFLVLRRARVMNKQLKQEMNEIKAKALLLNELDKENKRLRDMLGFKSRYVSSRLLPAEIVGRPGSNWLEIVEINRGASDNLVPDTAVINQEGLVGRVFEVSKYSSKILLITDPSSAISVMDAETGDMGILSGNLIGPLTIKYMSANASIKVGDKIITSGMSDIFPKGILVGRVKSVNKKDYDIFQRVEVISACNFSRLDKVFAVIR